MIMYFRNIFTYALLFVLHVLTNAAPPPNSQSSDQLSLLNVNGSTQLSAGFHFPPGPTPPEEPLFYDVPNSDPHLNIKFRDYNLRRPQERDVHITLHQAYAQCGDSRDRDVKMEEDKLYSWTSGQVTLQITPLKGNPDQEAELTYGEFANVLRALLEFNIAYRELTFGFEIYVYPEPSQDENYVGLGQLNLG